MQRELAALAKDVKTFLAGRDESTLSVGQFAGPTSMPSSAGPAISRTLTEELQKLGITVKARAKLTLEGRYRDVEDEKSSQLAVALKSRIVDKTDKVLVELDQRGIFGDASIVALMGLTVDLPPGGDTKVRDKQMRESIDKPTAYVTKTRIAAGKDSPYAIEVLIKFGDKYEPRAPKLKDGLPFVEIKRDEVYGVRLVNDSGQDAAVTLTIDGLNVFAFSDLKNKKTNQPLYQHYIIASKTSPLIKGWHRTNDLSNEFLVTEYAKSAAAELQSSANIGTITASFAAAWPKDGKAPADEPKDPKDHARSGDATGRGADVAAKFKEVERKFGVTRAAVSVRYTK